MPWTLRDICSEATTVAGYGPELTLSRASFYANLAQRDVANRLPAVEFERLATSSMSSGDDKMFLPADCERVINLSFNTGASGTGGRSIRQAAPWELDAQSRGTQTGTPDMYLSYATWLEFYPSPNSNYSLLLRYVARVSDITNLASVPSVDTRFHSAIFYKTVEYLAARRANAPLVSQFRALYERELTAQPSILAQRQHNRAGLSLRVQETED